MNKNLKWSDFDWFSKKTKVYIHDFYIKCNSVKHKDEKIIFPLKKLKKHLTLSISKKYIDFHATDDDGITHRSIFNFKTRKARKLVKKSVKLGRVAIRIIPFENKELKKMIIVDPFSKKFIQYCNKICDCNIFPYYLPKIQVKKDERTHGKLLVAFSRTGELKGMLKCNHRKNGFEFVSASPMLKIKNQLINQEHIKKRLIEEGLQDDGKTELLWKKWHKFVLFFSREK